MMPGTAIDILLVEDNPHDIELAIHAFKKNNIDDKVHIVRDGVEALDYLFSNGRYAERRVQDDPKIILLDLKLQKVDGLSVLKKIKSDERTKSIPVIALTTSKEPSDVSLSYLYGVNSYFVKPVNFEEFAEAIRSITHYWLSLNHFPNGE